MLCSTGGLRIPCLPEAPELGTPPYNEKNLVHSGVCYRGVLLYMSEPTELYLIVVMYLLAVAPGTNASCTWYQDVINFSTFWCRILNL